MYENYNNQYPNGTYPAPAPVNDPDVEAYVDAAFGKSLAATIMCGFPVASIIAIFFGCTGLNLVETAKRLASERGVVPSGKNIAATVLGKIGKIAGIVMTAFWAFYIFMIFIIILSNM